MNTFFVSCPMDFENELIKEVESFWFQLIDLDGLPTRETLPEFLVHVGGIEFKTQLHLGLQINFFSHIALRVLLRIGGFEARYFDQFERGISALELEKIIAPQALNVLIESSKSRLFHEGNLLESCTKVLAQKKYSYSRDADTTLLIRLTKDRVIVSIDTSGEHLHFRGYRKNQGEAPIRENLASLILQVSQLGFKKDQYLLDPYCGSGTFFFEAQLRNFPNFNRDYAFFKFKNTPALFKSESWKKNYRWVNSDNRSDSSKHIKFLGIEKNAQTLAKAELNVIEFQKLFCPIEIQFMAEDSEKIELIKLENIIQTSDVHLVTNPPYGERSESGSVAQNLARFENLKNLKSISVIHPDHWKFQFKRLKRVHSVPLSNQGLKTTLSLFR